MKNLFPVLPLLAILLSGCSSFHQPGSLVPGGASSSPAVQQEQTSARQIFDEANRLAGLVQQGQLTKTAAANQLDTYRLALVGPNRVDDATFATYRYLAKMRDANKMTSEEAHARMEMKLREWQGLWAGMQHRPANPAFTNFLMQLFKLPMLQADPV